jgi:hypothetical protein
MLEDVARALTQPTYSVGFDRLLLLTKSFIPGALGPDYR